MKIIPRQVIKTIFEIRDEFIEKYFIDNGVIFFNSNYLSEHYCY